MTANISKVPLSHLHFGKLRFFDQMSIFGEESLIDEVMVLDPGERPKLSAGVVIS